MLALIALLTSLAFGSTDTVRTNDFDLERRIGNLETEVRELRRGRGTWTGSPTFIGTPTFNGSLISNSSVTLNGPVAFGSNIGSTNTWTAPNTFTANLTFSSTVVVGSSLTAISPYGYGIAVWAKSMDGATQSSGCVVAVTQNSTGTATTIFTSTTTLIDVSIIVPGVLLESCAPLTFCRVGIKGIFQVSYSLNTGSGYVSSGGRCLASDDANFDGNAIGYWAGARPSATGHLGWLNLR